MKNKILLTSISIFLLIVNISNAQFVFTAPSGFKFGQTERLGLAPNWIKSIGIGNFTTFGAQPLAALNVNQFFLPNSTGFAPGNLFRTDGINTNDNNWLMYTGATAGTSTLKARMYIPSLSTMLDVEGTTAGIQFDAAGGISPSGVNLIQQRMIVSNGDFNDALGLPLTPNVTRVGISYGGGIAPITQPLAMLHLGYSSNPGYRNWMDIGTYMAKGDNMYVGLKDEAVPPGLGSNRQDAVINWGDDGTTSPGIGPDNLRFIFTGGSGPAAAAAFDGFEAGRVTPFANWGIGNFYNSPLFPFGNPVRRMEILSDKAAANVNGTPQLRLTHTQQNPLLPLTTGKISEFATTTLGNLIITTNDNTQVNTATKTLKERFVGINTVAAPGNTLEINSQFVSAGTLNGDPIAPGFTAPTGWAGLRFSDLQASSIPEINPGQGVLSVNKFGDVIYVPGNSGTGIGNYCAATPNPLTADYQIPMADHNYHFSDNGSVLPMNNVGIGTNCIALTARLQVVNPVMNFGIDATTTTATANNVGIRGTALNGTSNSYGVYGQAITAGPVFNTGVYGHGANSVQTSYGGQFIADGATGTTNMGVQAFAVGGSNGNYGVNSNANGGTFAVAVNGTASAGSMSNFGGRFSTLTSGTANIGVAVQGFATGAAAANINIGVRGKASNGTSANYGVYGEAALATPIGGVLNSYAGFFNGDVYLGGTIYPSDLTIKQTIDTISNALGILGQLHPKTYQFNPAVHPRMNLPTGLQYGLIAQEVETVLPTLVEGVIFPPDFDSTGAITDPSFQIKGLNYEQFIPILIKGIQEQQRGIDSLKIKNSKQDSINTSLQNQINQLTTIINSCCSNHSMQQNNNSNGNGNSNTIGSSSAIDVNLKDGQSIVLEQNVPNPFAEQTTINYYLPDNVVKAQMLFYNAQGILIQSVDLNERGKGSLNVFAQDLSNGIYTYTLVADGKVIETKKMLKQQ